MFRRMTALLLMICLLGLMLCACGKTLTAEEAYQVVLDDLGDRAEEAQEPHIHESTYKKKACYNIFVTVGDESLVYVVSTKGEILHKGIGAHSH
ncbi:MAG: hypothetical protein J6Q54_06450 [Oscillospiraceae bacterium]|nr:hypothetical protein [Oscillospiraceae bacterium]